MKVRAAVVALALSLPLLVASSAPVGAHTWSDWHAVRWQTGLVGGIDNDRTVQWRFVDNFPTDGSRGASRNGAQEWNNRTTMDFDYALNQPDYGLLNWDAGCSEFSYQEDKVGWDDFGDAGYASSEPLASVKHCEWTTEGAMHSFRIKVNNDAPWYSGTGEVPSNKYDMWGVMAHEFGHATGRFIGGDGGGHFNESSIYCPGDYVARHTMCPSLEPGRKGQRELETHDLDVFVNAY